MPKLTACIGTSADLFPDLAHLYLKPGDTIADVTYGNGVFWRHLNPDNYNLIKSDLLPQYPDVVEADCRNLRHLEDQSLDALVLDPPFMAGVKVKGRLNKQYHVNELNLRYAGVLLLYQDAILEACRVLKPKGILIAKCQDIVESGRRHFAHIQILEISQDLGFAPIDLGVLVNPRTPMMRHKDQTHLRSNHSYFWVLHKSRA